MKVPLLISLVLVSVRSLWDEFVVIGDDLSRIGADVSIAERKSRR